MQEVDMWCKLRFIAEQVFDMAENIVVKHEGPETILHGGNERIEDVWRVNISYHTEYMPEINKDKIDKFRELAKKHGFEMGFWTIVADKNYVDMDIDVYCVSFRGDENK